jgi:hypothetical protein
MYAAFAAGLHAQVLTIRNKRPHSAPAASRNCATQPNVHPAPAACAHPHPLYAPNQGIDFVAVNTDAQALAHHSAPNKLQIGNQVGAGAPRHQRKRGPPCRTTGQQRCPAGTTERRVGARPAWVRAEITEVRACRACPQVTRGLGCGGNPELGRHAAQESQDALKKVGVAPC